MADPRQREEGGLVARSCGWNLDCIRELLRAGASTEQVDEIGLTPLLAATRAGNTAAIAILIEAVCE